VDQHQPLAAAVLDTLRAHQAASPLPRPRRYCRRSQHAGTGGDNPIPAAPGRGGHGRG
jgi:hypothetical protein